MEETNNLYERECRVNLSDQSALQAHQIKQIELTQIQATYSTLPSLITPYYLFDSMQDYSNYFEKENYITTVKSIQNKKEFAILSNDDKLRLFKIDDDHYNNKNFNFLEEDKCEKIMKNSDETYNNKIKVNEIFSFNENHHLYDLEMYLFNLIRVDYMIQIYTQTQIKII